MSSALYLKLFICGTTPSQNHIGGCFLICCLTIIDMKALHIDLR